MSSGLRPPHWQTRAGECASIAHAFRLKLEREGERWLILREQDCSIAYPAQTLADVETWLNGYGWGFRYEPRA